MNIGHFNCTSQGYRYVLIIVDQRRIQTQIRGGAEGGQRLYQGGQQGGRDYIRSRGRGERDYIRGAGGAGGGAGPI